MLSVVDTGPFTPCPTPFNMAAYVLRHAQAQPDAPALCVLGAQGEEIWRFSDIEAAVKGIAYGLQARGLPPGARIVLRLGNRPDTPIAYLGAIAADMVPVPTSPQLTSREVATICDQLKPAAVIAEPGIASPPHPHTIPLNALQTMMGGAQSEPVAGDPNRPAYIVYTSGTSGVPRAVEHAHRAIWARQMMHKDWYGLEPSDRVLHAGAFNWTYTMGTGLMDPWSVGATALIPAPGTELSQLPDLIARHRATLFAAAPGVYRKFLTEGMDWHAPALRRGLSAGEKVSPLIRSLWQTITKTEICEAYGLSECSTFISAPPGAEVLRGATGQAQTGRHIALVTEDGAPVPRGDEGIIAIHETDPGLMRGYIGAPEEDTARRRGSWFLTGDKAVMGDDGWVTYLGRSDDMMNAGGFRVSPLEVEHALSDMPGIDALAVTDVEVKPDLRVIIAFFVSSAPLAPETMRDFASSRLAAYKQPKDYIRVPQLPTGPNGKLIRARLASLWRLDDQA